MTEAAEITESEIRNALLTRAAAFAERTGYSFSRMSEEALKDSKFLANVRAGKNFTVRTYQRMIEWLDAADASVPDKRAAEPERVAS